jgi:minor histocompatibility antigen H13
LDFNLSHHSEHEQTTQNNTHTHNKQIDVFWVFCTPVMVAVARDFEAPIKLLFPRSSLRAALASGTKPAFAMLGLGDIVLPGLFVALCLRYDRARGYRSTYFRTCFFAYVAGVAATIVVMNTFKAAQPALLYIVPSTLGAVAAHAALRGELEAVFHWHEDGAEGGGGGAEGAAAAADKQD